MRGKYLVRPARLMDICDNPARRSFRQASGELSDFYTVIWTKGIHTAIMAQTLTVETAPCRYIQDFEMWRKSLLVLYLVCCLDLCCCLTAHEPSPDSAGFLPGSTCGDLPKNLRMFTGFPWALPGFLPPNCWPQKYTWNTLGYRSKDQSTKDKISHSTFKRDIEQIKLYWYSSDLREVD